MSDDNRIYGKLDKIESELVDMKVILGKQEENLRLHMYRTEIAEENIQLLKKQLSPIESYLKSISIFLKFIGVISIFAGLVLTIINIYKSF